MQSGTIHMIGERLLAVGPEHWPVSEFTSHDIAIPSTLREGWIDHHRRAAIVFESGWIASILWGDHTYSDNYDCWLDSRPFTEEPRVVEVGVCHADRGLVGDPFGRVDADALNALLGVMGRWSSDWQEGARFVLALQEAE